MRSHDPFGTCRNCGCHIMWIKTKAGKNMPVDPTMISYRRPEAGAKAKEKIVTPEGEVVCADKVSSESAEGFGADMLITACPLCMYNLKKSTVNGTPIYYFTELLAEALGVKEEVTEA